MDTLDEKIDSFLAAPSFGVVGASDDPRKYGNKVYRTYLSHKRTAYPINPSVSTVLGNPAYANLAALPEKVESVSVITPPAVTEKVVEEAIKMGVKNIWMQPGAESDKAVRAAEEAGINVIHGGPCLLVVMGYHE
ncbi:MAG TPA: CoA-binding protein [Planktothrix sp.]|jgi:predicted CoA-binding protein